MKNRVGREGGKWSEYAWDRGDVPLSFSLATILK